MAWTLTGVSIVLTIGRFIIRYRTRSALQWDDLTHGFALLALLVFMALYTRLFPLTVELLLYSVGVGPMPSPAQLSKFFHLLVPTEIMFWVVLYAVKVTFLLLYREIFGVKKNFMRFWWAVMAYTIITFLIAFFTVFWSCGSPSQLYNLRKRKNFRLRRGSKLTFSIEACLSPAASTATDNFATTNVPLNVLGDILSKHHAI